MIIFISLNVFICSLVVMIFDIKFRVIPNALVFSFTLIALVSHLVVNGWQGLVFSTTGLVMGFFLLFIFYLFKMVGAGDVKYLACLGAWLGTSIVVVFILTSFLGGLLALFYLLKSKYKSWRNKTTIKPESLPYGVAISAGAVLTMFLQFFNGNSP